MDTNRTQETFINFPSYNKILDEYITIETIIWKKNTFDPVNFKILFELKTFNIIYFYWYQPNSI